MMLTFVDSPLAYRLELGQAGRAFNYARAYQKLHPEAETAVEPLAGGFAIYCANGSPLNRAIGLGFSRPVEPADLEWVEDFYHSRQETPRVDLCPLADPSLLRLLASRGYTIERFYNILYTQLEGKTFQIHLPDGMRVEPVTENEAGLWLRTTAQGFAESDEPGAEIFSVLGPNLYAENAICYLVWIDGQPAGGGGMYLHQGVAEFGGASTRMAYRRQGVQSALLRVRLAAAQEQGCDLAMVMTTPGSESQKNIQRSGLRLGYTRAVMAKHIG